MTTLRMTMANQQKDETTRKPLCLLASSNQTFFMNQFDDSDSDDDSCSESDTPPPKSTKLSSSSATRRVRFSSSADSVSKCLHLNDYTDEEFDNAWYCKEDFVAMRRDFASTIRMVQSNLPLPSTLSFRGLEYKTVKGCGKRRANKLAGWSAVLQEQAKQHLHHSFGSSTDVSRKYKVISAKCLVDAQLLAKRDEAYVKFMNKQQQGPVVKRSHSCCSVSPRPMKRFRMLPTMEAQ